MQTAAIIDEYLTRRESFRDLARYVVTELERQLREPDVKIHSVTWRVKSRESLEGKLARPDRVYRRLGDVTDVIGIRIITYFEDSIERVAALLEKLYQVDLERSTDKRKSLASDRFGYQSLHYICRLPANPSSSNLDESLTGVRFEIQLCTVLQHAWAEIEHDLGYKSRALVPERIRRRFSRLAGLLEIADDEFVEIRKSLQKYEVDVATRIEESSSEVPIDLHSLHSFVRTDRVNKLDRALADKLGKQLGDTIFFPDYLAAMLAHLEIGTIETLSGRLEQRETEIVEFVEPYLDFTRAIWELDARDMDALPRGYGILLMGHLEALFTHSLALECIETMTAFFHQLDYPDDEEAARQVAAAFVDRFKGYCG